MNDDLVRRGDVKTSVCREENADTGCGDGCDGKCYYMTVIDRIPTVNAVEVIRCKDCKWYVIEQLKKDGTDDRRYKPSYCLSLSFHPNSKWFCADGERREDETD